jgi:hypothetical protein
VGHSTLEAGLQRWHAHTASAAQGLRTLCIQRECKAPPTPQHHHPLRPLLFQRHTCATPSRLCTSVSQFVLQLCAARSHVGQMVGLVHAWCEAPQHLRAHLAASATMPRAALCVSLLWLFAAAAHRAWGACTCKHVSAGTRGRFARMIVVATCSPFEHASTSTCALQRVCIQVANGLVCRQVCTGRYVEPTHEAAVDSTMTAEAHLQSGRTAHTP